MLSRMTTLLLVVSLRIILYSTLSVGGGGALTWVWTPKIDTATKTFLKFDRGHDVYRVTYDRSSKRITTGDMAIS